MSPVNHQRCTARGTAAALMMLGLGSVPDALAGGQLSTIRVADGLNSPVYAVAPVGDFRRLFILEKDFRGVGRLRILNLPGHTLNASPYLSIDPVGTLPEQGMLGLAFHPEFLSNGYFWIHYVDANGVAIVARYRANAPYATSTSADAGSTEIVLTLPQAFENHYGGWMGFGADDFLYIAKGDGGGYNDPHNNGQDILTRRGKLLRIDVDGLDNIPGNDDDDGLPGSAAAPYTSPSTNPYIGATPGLDELWAIGLRNPWRCSFDRLNGNLYIGDVGQDEREELNVQAANTLPPLNYGWRCTEGTFCTGLTGCTCNAPSLRAPIHQYVHPGGNCSIIGGYVYRGCNIPGLQGTYFFADYCAARIFSCVYTGDGTTRAVNVIERSLELSTPGFIISSITSFGEDAFGELYICDQGGEVFKIISQSPSFPDCNNNGMDDACDVSSGGSADVNRNGVPDECDPPPPRKCTADIAPPPSGNGEVNVDDLLAVINHWGPCQPGPPCIGDIAPRGGNQAVNVDDLLVVINAWGACR